jgi:hypothetical protein
MESPLQNQLFGPLDCSKWQHHSAAGGEFRYRCVNDNLILIDTFDGKILKVTKQSQDRYFTRQNGKEIRARGWENFAELIIAAREAQLARARRRQAQVVEDQAVDRMIAIVESGAEGQRTAKPRSRNKLASKRVSQSADFQPRFINPKLLIGKDANWWFAPRFVWLKYGTPGMTGAEQDAYSCMVFRASDDGVFRGSVRALANDVNCSRRHLHDVIQSLLARGLIVREDRGPGSSAWFRFVDPEQLGWRTLFNKTDELCSLSWRTLFAA